MRVLPLALALISTAAMAQDAITIGAIPEPRGGYQTIIGMGVKGDDTTGAVYIGHDDIYLKLAPDGTVTLHGTKDPDQAVAAVLSGLKVVIGQNPYYCHKENYPTNFGLDKDSK